MIRSPNFQVRKRKWKTVLFLLRKRKRKNGVDGDSRRPDDDGGDRGVNPRNEVDWKFEGFEKGNPRLGLDDDDDGDAYCSCVDERDVNPRNDVDLEFEGSEKDNVSLGLDHDDDGESPRNDGDWEFGGSEKENLRLRLDYVVGGDGEEEVDGSLKSAVTVVSERKKDGGDAPPDDDCCPICFDNFSIACKTNCGHWFCANCILQFWTYRTVLQKCNCPICARPISKLTPEASLLMMHEVEVVEVLKNVQRYNRLFQGGINGVIRKVFEVPNLFKRMLCGLMDPDRFRGNYYAMRSFALFMSCIYNIGSFEFIPTGSLGVRRLFDLCAIALVVILCLVGICHRLLLRQRVRLLAAHQL